MVRYAWDSLGQQFQCHLCEKEGFKESSRCHSHHQHIAPFPEDFIE